uniref:SH3 domain-containing protein n=1 Tax=Biomphalaria glabrata TaxID=6526 RepID=A0A2C9L587_BIOGL
MAAYNVFSNFMVLLLFLLSYVKCVAKIEPISNKRLCADKECNVIISKGKALASHLHNHPSLLQFRKDDIIEIKSKSAGDNPRLWGGVCNGQHGYFDRNFVRELQVFVHNPQFLVNTEVKQFGERRQPPPPSEKANRRDHFVKDEKILNVKEESKISDELEPATDSQDDPAEEQKDPKDSETNTEINQEENLEKKEEENQSDDEPWDTLDNDYFEVDRDRFDTSGFVTRIIDSLRALNQFVKQKLSVESEKAPEGNKDDADAAFLPSPADAVEDTASKKTQVDPDVKVEQANEQPLGVATNEQPTIESTPEKPSVELPNKDVSIEPTNEINNPSNASESAIKEPAMDLSKEKTVERSSDNPSVDLPDKSVDLPDNSYSSETKTSLKEESDKSSTAPLDKGSVTLPKASSVLVDGDSISDLPPNVNEVNTDEHVGSNAQTQTNEDQEEYEVEEISTQDVDVDLFMERNEHGSKVGESGKATSTDEKGKLVDRSNDNIFPIDEEEEDGDIGTDIPVYSASSVSKDAGQKEQKTTQNEPQTVEVPTAEYTDQDEDSEDKDADAQLDQQVKEEEDPTAVEEEEDPTTVEEEDPTTVEEEEDPATESEDKNIIAGEVERLTPTIAAEDVSKNHSDDEDITADAKQVLGSNADLEAEEKQASDKSDKISTNENLAMPKVETEFKNNLSSSENILGTTSNEIESETSSEVRPDSPSGVTPEQGQVDDPLSTNVSKESNHGTLEPTALKENDKKETDETDQKLNPVDLELFQRDEANVLPGGFEGFLQPSISETHSLDEPSSTPGLDSVVVESLTTPPVEEIKSTKTLEDKLETAQEIKPDVPAANIFETIIEAGSTLILDADGNMVTAILPADTVSSVVEVSSSVNKPAVTPTAVVETTESSSMSDAKTEAETRDDVLLHSSVYTEVNSTVVVKTDHHLLDTDTSHIYRSSDFSSRKVLSVNHQPPQHYTEHPHEHKDHDHTDHDHGPHDHSHHNHEHHDHGHHDHDHDIHDHSHHDHPLKQDAAETSPVVEPTLAPELTKTQIANAESSAVKEEPLKEDAASGTESQNLVSSKEINVDERLQNKVESSTQPSQEYEIPQPPTSDSGEDSMPQDFDSGSTYHSRKMSIDELPEEEPKPQPSEGFLKTMFLFLELPAKFVIERLPPSVQSLLEQEPLGLSPTLTVMVALFSISVLLTACLSSLCSSGGKKSNIRATLDVINELEAKLQLAIKEKENIEDSIKDFKTENIKLKEEMTKQKRDSGKNQTEIHTVQLHNETLKKQVHALEAEMEELRQTASTKQGEVKQTNKKTKEMEKQIKKLEERERNLDQEKQKLMTELRHKEDETASLQSKVSSLTDQIGHLQTSKDQLLSEAEDWKEKVTDLKERLEQREEEFKQMQENIMFKDNELEVLKDCFLQLKSFEEGEIDSEDGDVSSERVQEKLSAMMDVSKVNASLRAIDEERNMLANRLQIESEARKELEEQLENSRRSVESSMADKMKAERQCQEAQTKLNVLSSYFKEKEMQLQRELGEHEALKKQNLNKLVSADETTRSMQQEVEILRTQVESLKRELASSERDFRSQIAANEKKAHENWLAARAAERELKESRHEAGVMRQKLTDLERRQVMGPGGLIRPLPTRGLPPPGMLNGPPPPPGMDRSPSRSSLPPLPPHLRDEEFLRRGPPPGIRPPHPEARSPPLPPFKDARSPPPRMPPPGMLDGRSPPPYDRRPPPPHMLDRRSPPFRMPPPDMLPHPMRGGPLPPPHFPHGGSPSSGADSPHLDRADGRYPPPYARNPPFPPDRPSPRGPAPRQQQSQV